MAELAKVIAIDGPGGSGKSTIAKLVAKELNILYIDTGAMFRAIGYYLYNKKIAWSDTATIQKELATMNIEYNNDVNRLICINNENLSQKIREHFVSELASQVSKVVVVREFLLKFQRNLVQKHFCVMEGRDIGTVVFPSAFLKVFFTASDEVRAQRRLNELKNTGDSKITFDQILKDIRERDESDKNRAIAPLKQAPDAHLLDTSKMTQREVIDNLVALIRERAKSLKLDLSV